MSHIKFDYKTALPFVAQHEFDYLQPAVTAFDAALRAGSAPAPAFTPTITQKKKKKKKK